MCQLSHVVAYQDGACNAEQVWECIRCCRCVESGKSKYECDDVDDQDEAWGTSQLSIDGEEEETMFTWDREDEGQGEHWNIYAEVD